jgi:hypothetical protein
MFIIDEKAVIEILCGRTKAQLEAIDLVYRQKYRVSLLEFVNSEIGGNTGRFLGYLQMSNAELDANLIRDCMQGVGCDKKVIVTIMCTRPFDRLQAMRYDALHK